MLAAARARDAAGSAAPWDEVMEAVRALMAIAPSIRRGPGRSAIVQRPDACVQHEVVAANTVDHVLLCTGGFYRLVDVFGTCDERGLLAAPIRVSRPRTTRARCWCAWSAPLT